jgi:DNA-binding NarL/FixJ family response regulator
VTVGPRALVADSQAVTRLGIRRALERAGIAVVAEASDASGAVAAARRRRPELCVLDVQLPGGGLAATSEILATTPGASVALLSESCSGEEVLAALRAGAVGYIGKDVGPAALGRAAHAVLDGEVVLPRALMGRVTDELRCRADRRRARTAMGTWATLSERESEVLELLRYGRTTQQVAEQLGISAVTVRRHVSRVERRLGVHDRAALLQLTAASRAPGSRRDFRGVPSRR